MSWARFDDRFWSHPKVLLAGNEAVGAFVRMVCYACEHLTDGHVPSGVATMIAVRAEVLDKLIEVRLLVADGDGYRAPDFLEFNPSRTEVTAKRAADAARMKAVRANRTKSSAVRANTPRTHSELASDSDATPARVAVTPARPVPIQTERDPARTRVAPPVPSEPTGEWPQTSPPQGHGEPEAEPATPRLPTVERPNALDGDAVFDTLLRSSGGAIRTNAPAQTASAFVAAVREAGYTLDDLAALGRYVAAGGCAWAKRKTFDLTFFVSHDRGADRLTELITKALEADVARAPAPRPTVRVVRPAHADIPVATPEFLQANGFGDWKARRGR